MVAGGWKETWGGIGGGFLEQQMVVPETLGDIPSLDLIPRGHEKCLDIYFTANRCAI